jgi:hypothetical protein
MWFLFSLRIKQAFRLFRETGWGILLVLVVVTAGVWVPALARLAALSPGLAFGAGIVLAGWLHLGRSDGTLIKQTALPAWKICLLDTALALLPVGLFLLLATNYTAAAAWFGGLAVVLLPNSTLAKVQYRRLRFDVPGLPVSLFELRTAVRSFPVGWVLALLLQMGVWYHIAFLLAAVAWGLMLVSITFQFLEPVALLPRDKHALWVKWRQYALILFAFFLPGFLQALIWQSDYLWLILYAAAAFQTYLMLTFFYKYAVWRPGLQGLSGNTYSLIGLLLVLMPGGLLIALPMAARAAFRARTTIQNWCA